MMKKFAALLLALMLLPMAALAESREPFLRMGGSFAFGIDAGGKVWGWGDNRLGQIGHSRKALIGEPVEALQGLDGMEILDIQCGNENTLILMKNGEVYGTGANSHAQLGIEGIGSSTNVPTKIDGLENIIQIDSGFGQSLALDKDGHVWGWGKNSSGQVGDGTRKTAKTPVQLPLENIVQIGCGGKYSIAMDANGVIWTWGENDYGQLGFKTRHDFCETPTALNLGSYGFVSIAAGGDTAYALDGDGHVWAWGRNEIYQCGTDDVKDVNYDPVRAEIPDEVRIVKIIGYNSHAMAIADNGDLYHWGNGDCGQRGEKRKVLKNLPGVVMQNVADASAGSLASVLLLKDGTVWGAGLNKYGQCGVRYSYNRQTQVRPWAYTGLDLDDCTWARPPKE